MVQWLRLWATTAGGQSLVGNWDPTYWTVKVKASHSVVSDYLWPCGLYSPWNSPGQNTGVGSLSLLQGIFPTQGLNPGLLHCRWILYQLSHKGSPRILEWVAYPFSRGSSRPRNRTGVSCIAGSFFTNWVTREEWQNTHTHTHTHTNKWRAGPSFFYGSSGWNTDSLTSGLSLLFL